MKAKIFVGDRATGKTRIAKMISEFFEPGKVAILDGRRFNSNHFFPLQKIPSDTKLLIIDDCPEDFDYEYFFPYNDNRFYEGDISFRITVERQGEEREIIEVPFLIFTTNKIKPKWKFYGASFSERFDVVYFPISGQPLT